MDKLDNLKKTALRSKNEIAIDAIKLQIYIAEFHPKLTNLELTYKYECTWDVGPQDASYVCARHAAKLKGFQEEDFIERNAMIRIRNAAIKPLQGLDAALIASYVTSSNYFNISVRRRLNPIYSSYDEPLTMKMEEIAAKFLRESNDAAYSMGRNLKNTTDGMLIIGKLKRALSASLLRSLVEGRSEKYSSYRGVFGSRSFVTSLDYFSKIGAIVKVDQFLSTSLNLGVAKNFANGNWDSNKILDGKKIIFFVDGISGARISAYLDEAEVLYPPDTHFKITAGSYKDHVWALGAKVYKLTEVPSREAKDDAPYLIDFERLKQLERISSTSDVLNT